MGVVNSIEGPAYSTFGCCNKLINPALGMDFIQVHCC